MFSSSFSVFVLCGLFCGYAKASSLNELKQKFVELIIDCSANYSITTDDMAALREKQMPNSDSVKCLFACAYKKAGMMNDKGELWIEGVNEITRKYLADDPEKIKKSEEFTQACKYVNDVEVSDGAEGCERAALIFKCTVKRSPDFDFV